MLQWCPSRAAVLAFWLCYGLALSACAGRSPRHADQASAPAPETITLTSPTPTHQAQTPIAPASPGRTPERPTAVGVDWPLFDHDPQRSGINSEETLITPDTVGGLKRLWAQALPEKSGGAPILLSAIAMTDGSTRDLLFVTTNRGTTVALDAQTGLILWQQTIAGPQVPNQACQICATPAADPSRQWVYAAGNDAAVHRYAAATGREDRTPPWPVPVTLMNGYEKRSGALNLANGMLYVVLSGYFGDFGPYVGHVVAIRLADGATRVFNVLCSDQHQLLASRSEVPNAPASCGQREAGVWARAGAVVDTSDAPDGSPAVEIQPAVGRRWHRRGPLAESHRRQWAPIYRG